MGFREEDAALATRADFYKQLRDTFQAIAPLVQFLNEPLVASQQPDRRAHILDEPLTRFSA
jgi:hypothetical protein